MFCQCMEMRISIINSLTCKLGQEQILSQCNIEMCTIVILIIVNCHNRKHFTCGHYKMVINQIVLHKIIMARVVFVQPISYYTIIIIVYISYNIYSTYNRQ